MPASIRLPNTIDRIKQTSIRDYVVYILSRGGKIDFNTMKTNTGISMDEYQKFIQLNPSIQVSKIGMFE